MNGDKPVEFMARREDWQNGISLYARHVFQDSSIFVAQPMVMVKHEEGLPVLPFASLGIQGAQQLIDELWNCGLRPSEGTGSAGSLKATQEHLSDMRRIAFKELHIKT